MAFFKGDLAKVTSYSAISTFVKMLAGMVSIKFVAMYVGPSGVSLLGQLRNFSSIITPFANGGFNIGVTKYIAEHQNEQVAQKKVIGTAFLTSLFLSFFTGIIIFSFSNQIASSILREIQYSSIFKIFGITIIFQSINLLLIAIINGYKEYKLWVIVNILSSILGLIITILLVVYWNLFGALVAAVVIQSVVVIATIIVIRNQAWFSIRYFFNGIDKKVLKKLSAFSLMAIVTALISPMSQLWLRTYIMDNISLVDAGNYEGILRVSRIYLLVITTAISTYYIPSLSEIKSRVLLRKKVLEAFRIIIPMILVISVVIWFSRILIIKILFSASFLGMGELFFFQLVGDFFKIASFILSVNMLAKAMTRLYIITEIIFGILILGLSLFFINKFGLIGVVYGYALNYFIYFVSMVIIFRKLIFIKTSE